MANALSDTWSQVSGNINFSGWLSTIMYSVIVVLVLGIWVGFFWWWSQKKLFKEKFVIFEKVGKSFEPAIRGVARFMTIGSVGDRVFLFKKPRAILPAPAIQTGRNTYWFFRRDDRELVNFGIENLDERARLLEAEMTNKDIASERLALEEFAKQRLRGKSWFLENLGMLVGIFFIIIVLVFIWLIFGKMADVSKGFASATETMQRLTETNTQLSNTNIQVVERLNRIIEGNPNLASAGSIIMPIPIINGTGT